MGTPSVLIASATAPDGKRLSAAKVSRDGDFLEVDLREEVVVPVGRALAIRLASGASQV